PAAALRGRRIVFGAGNAAARAALTEVRACSCELPIGRSFHRRLIYIDWGRSAPFCAQTQAEFRDDSTGKRPRAMTAKDKSERPRRAVASSETAREMN